MKKLHQLFDLLDKHFNFPKGTSKNEIKDFLGIKSVSKLEHDELIYLIRFVDNILLSNGIDYEEV